VAVLPRAVEGLAAAPGAAREMETISSPQRSMNCVKRGEKQDVSVEESWLTQQLKRVRDQLEKKSNFCDQLASELRKLEADLDARNKTIAEVKDRLRATDSELRAAALAGAAERAEHEEEAAALRLKAETLRQQVLSTCSSEGPQHEEGRAAQIGAGSLEVDSAAQAPLPPMSPPVAPGSPAAREGEARKALALAKATAEASVAVAAAAGVQREMEELRRDLSRERELHDEAMRLLKAVRAQGDEEMLQLQEELVQMSDGVEQKEEEILTIQFDMVALQNSLADQAQLVASNAEMFQMASEELAEKDERLEKAMEKQEELMAQILSLSELQEKVGKMSHELEGRKVAYQTLEEQTTVKVADLKSDRDALAAELKRVRTEADAQREALREELQQREAASEALKASLEEELRQVLSGAAAKAAAAVEELRKQLRSDEAAAAKATEAAVALVEELHESLAGALRGEGGAVGSRPPVAAAAAGREAVPPLPGFCDVSPPPRGGRGDSGALVASEERLALSEERLANAESKIHELTRALERSRLCERQAMERAQEYRTSLALYREFGHEGFLAAAPRVSETPPYSPERQGFEQCGPDALSRSGSHEGGVLGSVREDRSDCGGPRGGWSISEGGLEDAGEKSRGEVDLPSTLIAVELDLGANRLVTLRVAPWHTRSDFEAVVEEFLASNRVKMVFAEALVKYLEVVEAEAVSFPTFVKADLAGLYSQYG